MGSGTHRVPFSMHKTNRNRICERFKADSMSGGDNLNLLMIFKGGGERDLYDSDTQWDFRQEATFQWLFGVREPGCYGAINVMTGKR